jgi:hypothetical protein
LFDLLKTALNECRWLALVAPQKPTGKLRKLSPKGTEMPTQIGSGMIFPIARLIELLEPPQWEEFTEE